MHSHARFSHSNKMMIQHTLDREWHPSALRRKREGKKQKDERKHVMMVSLSMRKGSMSSIWTDRQRF